LEKGVQMKKQNKEAVSVGRRDFFRKAGFGVGAAGVAAAGLAAGSAGATEPQREPGKSAGYRETEHVKKFYELARY
jgi:hypothetical protein